MSYALCLKCHTIEGFNPCGCPIIICPNCRNIFDGRHTRLPDTGQPSIVGLNLTEIDLQLAHFQNGTRWVV